MKLYTLHPSPVRRGTIVVHHEGRLLRYRCPGSRDRHSGGGFRDVIGGFSHSSRRRMLLLLASLRIDAHCLPLFVTLTYPAFWPSEPETWKRHLDAFGKWLRRRYPAASAVWKLEPQQRGAPHFHLIVFGVPFIPHQSVSQAWYRIVGSCDPNHLAAGTEVRACETVNGVMSYASKMYMGKEVPGCPQFRCVGRFWGVLGRSELPRSAESAMTLCQPAIVTFGRIIRKRLKKKNVRSNGQSGFLFTGLPLDWIRLARFLDPAAECREVKRWVRKTPTSKRGDAWCSARPSGDGSERKRSWRLPFLKSLLLWFQSCKYLPSTEVLHCLFLSTCGQSLAK